MLREVLLVEGGCLAIVSTLLEILAVWRGGGRMEYAVVDPDVSTLLEILASLRGASVLLGERYQSFNPS